MQWEMGDDQPVKTAIREDGVGLVVARAADYSKYALYCIADDSAVLALETTSYLPDVQRVGSQVWVAARRSWIDASSLGGLMVWDIDQCREVTEGNWLSLGLEPVSIGFVP